ncbi:MAG: acetate kinase, partial [Desulfovibrionaceae bacterium]|nr:acetate kinase [Desulfovibrionaceae bacterium]
MKILVINSGSSSLKYQRRTMDTQELMCSGVVERIGDPMGRMVHKVAPDTERETKTTTDMPFENHVEAMKAVVAAITDPEHGVIKSKDEIHAIGHRVLTAGSAFHESKIVDEQVKRVIRDMFPLSPLHNPANLAGIETAEELFPGVPNVAVFDTEFHQTMPDYAYTYPLPLELCKKYQIRRYGFHGTSHRYVVQRTAEFMGKKPEE